jgi:hypothetical protein
MWTNRNTKIQIIISNFIDSEETVHSNDNSTSSLFQRRTEPVIPLVRPSPLTALLQSSTNKQNPFAHYAKFDGTVCQYQRSAGLWSIYLNNSHKFLLHI